MTTPTNNNTTVIGPDAHFKGELTFDGTAKVLGTFDGSISTKGEVAVGKGATCNADVHAGRVVVEGTVNGDLTGDELIELNAGAKIKGDINAGNLVVVEGASFEGHVRVGAGMTTKKAPAPTQATAAPAQASDAKPSEDRPQVQTRSLRPASTASETAASPSAASAAVARATADASNGSSWLKGESKDGQSAA